MKNENIAIGKSIPKHEAIDKVTGKAIYIADIKLPEMLYAKMLGSPHPHALIKEIDARKAEKMSGVKAVITAKNIPDRMLYPAHRYTRPYYPLTDHARCLGDAIAAVAAETEEIAEKAVEQIEVKYEVLPTVSDPEEAIKPDATQLHHDGNISDPGGAPELLEWGDVEKGLKEADFVAEGTFKMPQIIHAALEPRACIAKWDEEDEDKLVIWATTQTPFAVRHTLADYFDIPVNNITVKVHNLGGGFGGKEDEQYFGILSLLAKKCGRPVKFVYSRDLDSLVRARWGGITKAKVGAKKDGTITAIDLDQIYDVGAYGNPDGGSGTTMGAVNVAIYRTENCRIKAYNVNTNMVTGYKLRSVYVPTYRFSVEQLMDMIEEWLGKEPGELRLEKNIKPGEKIMPYGNIMDNHAMDICLKKAKEAAGWAMKWKGWRKPVSIDGPKHRGIGIGFGTGWCDWFREQHLGTIVELCPDGKVILTTGVTDIGTGNLTTISQIVAEVLGFPSVQCFEIKAPNTLGTEGDMPFDRGTIASRTLFVGGWAARMAAAEVKEKVLQMAATKFQEDPSDFDIYDNVISSKRDKRKKVHLRDLISEPIVGSAYPPLPKVIGRAKRYEYYAAPVEVHIAEVEVDTETGETKVVNFVAAHDAGKAINPQIVENQIRGGVIQGISFVLYEELVFDRERNIFLNPDFMDYKIANIADIPPIEVILIEDAPATFGPFGAKGVGEHPVPSVFGAVSNAIYNAVGIRPKETPITPERMLKWLKEKKQEKS
ncbi:MAG: xanthine dehydrogenase family protein molybdopterin-binding subunit [Deltaproteobacteria bacterium]|nr:xanthine dehydrogenase family protein molybdopterin-binding subunit [Deltaproteobacteria bacterium]MBW2044415.1 xanthine dehydrogenase family protein molybdopterin-binding subunit [Deltaproteobacteria bacterium]